MEEWHVHVHCDFETRLKNEGFFLSLFASFSLCIFFFPRAVSTNSNHISFSVSVYVGVIELHLQLVDLGLPSAPS